MPAISLLLFDIVLNALSNSRFLNFGPTVLDQTIIYVDGVLCIVGCLAATLASTLSHDKQKCHQTLPSAPYGAKLLLFETNCFKRNRTREKGESLELRVLRMRVPREV